MQRREGRISEGTLGAVTDAAIMAAALIALAVVVSVLTGGTFQRVVAHAAIMLTGVAALQIFSGNAGIVSFGHAAFMGIGAYTVGILTLSLSLKSTALPELPAFMAGYELTLLPALAVAALVGVVTGMLFGTIFLRLSGISASIATLALLIIVYSVLVATREITRGSQPFYGVPRNVGLWTTVFFAAASLSAARLFRDSPWGIAVRAAAGDAQAAAAVGIDRRRALFVAWTASVMVASLAGGLLAQFLGAFSPHSFYFDLAFTMLAMLIVGGIHSSLGALAGVSITSVLIESVRRFEGGVEIAGVTLPSFFGLTQAVLAVAMIIVIWRRPNGLVGGSELNALRRLRTPRKLASQAAPTMHRTSDCIVVRSLTKRYAGLTALDNVSLTITRDNLTGLIGPNGAGKTTLINLISGHLGATSGEIKLGQTLLTGAAPHTIARRGISRTFQNLRIFREMTVLENVVVAARQVESGLAAAERRAFRELCEVGLDGHVECPASSLAPGLQRRLEIARALATNPRFLLLDEPAAGMNAVETATLVDTISRVQRERGTGIVLIEHDIKLVMRHCQRVIVLDGGKLIADGPPAEVQTDPAVISAYLGRGNRPEGALEHA